MRNILLVFVDCLLLVCHFENKQKQMLLLLLLLASGRVRHTESNRSTIEIQVTLYTVQSKASIIRMQSRIDNKRESTIDCSLALMAPYCLAFLSNDRRNCRPIRLYNCRVDGNHPMPSWPNGRALRTVKCNNYWPWRVRDFDWRTRQNSSSWRCGNHTESGCWMHSRSSRLEIIERKKMKMWERQMTLGFFFLCSWADTTDIIFLVAFCLSMAIIWANGRHIKTNHSDFGL